MAKVGIVTLYLRRGKVSKTIPLFDEDWSVSDHLSTIYDMLESGDFNDLFIHEHAPRGMSIEIKEVKDGKQHIDQHWREGSTQSLSGSSE